MSSLPDDVNPADGGRRRTKDLSVFGDQINPHSRFPSGKNQRNKKPSAVTRVPDLPPGHFFRPDPAAPSFHPMRLRSARVNSNNDPTSVLTSSLQDLDISLDQASSSTPDMNGNTSYSGFTSTSTGRIERPWVRNGPPGPSYTDPVTLYDIVYNTTSHGQAPLPATNDAPPSPPQTNEAPPPLKGSKKPKKPKAPKAPRTTTAPTMRTPGQRGKDPKRSLLPRPTPTPDYQHFIKQGHLPLSAPRPLLVILDLNGVLVYRKKQARATERTDLEPFLTYLFKNHHVMIWSSGMPENVQKICQRFLTPPQSRSLIAIWARDTLRLPPALFREHIQVYKQLSWIWESAALQAKAALPTALCEEAVGLYSQSNTVLIDDSVEKAIAEPCNLLPVEEFVGQAESVEGGKGVLMRVIDYLERLRWVSDVSAYMYEHPFNASQARK